MRRLDSTDARNYKAVLGQFCTGVTVVTTIHRETPVGFTCQSFSALSLEPPQVLLCPGKGSTTWPKVRDVGRFTVNLLASGQQDVATRFARSGADKFAGTDWTPSATGLPVLGGALAWIECSLVDEVDAGDHTIAIASVSGLGDGPGRNPLLFFRSTYAELRMKESMNV